MPLPPYESVIYSPEIVVTLWISLQLSSLYIWYVILFIFILFILSLLNRIRMTPSAKSSRHFPRNVPSRSTFHSGKTSSYLLLLYSTLCLFCDNCEYCRNNSCAAPKCIWNNPTGKKWHVHHHNNHQSQVMMTTNDDHWHDLSWWRRPGTCIRFIIIWLSGAFSWACAISFPMVILAWCNTRVQRTYLKWLCVSMFWIIQTHDLKCFWFAISACISYIL